MKFIEFVFVLFNSFIYEGVLVIYLFVDDEIFVFIY